MITTTLLNHDVTTTPTPTNLNIALFAWLISHQPTVLFSQNKPATSNQPAVLFFQNKSSPATSNQPNRAHCPHNWKFSVPTTCFSVVQ
jgi:hypothetical protein